MERRRSATIMEEETSDKTYSPGRGTIHTYGMARVYPWDRFWLVTKTTVEVLVACAPAYGGS